MKKYKVIEIVIYEQVVEAKNKVQAIDYYAQANYDTSYTAKSITAKLIKQGDKK
jgi:hypothetical protein